MHGTPRYLQKYHDTLILMYWAAEDHFQFLRSEWFRSLEWFCLRNPWTLYPVWNKPLILKHLNLSAVRDDCPELEWPQKLLMALIMLELSGWGQVRPGKHTEQRHGCHTHGSGAEDCDYDVTFWQAAADWVTFAWTPVNDQSMQTHTLCSIIQTMHTQLFTKT